MRLSDLRFFRRFGDSYSRVFEYVFGVVGFVGSDVAYVGFVGCGIGGRGSVVLLGLGYAVSARESFVGVRRFRLVGVFFARE